MNRTQGKAWAQQNPDTAYAFVPDSLRTLWHEHAKWLEFHNGLSSPHPWESNPWSWLVTGRPILLVTEDHAERIVEMDEARSILDETNVRDLHQRLEGYAHNSAQDRRHLLTDGERAAAEEARTNSTSGTKSGTSALKNISTAIEGGANTVGNFFKIIN